jgi:hypothetical protein
LISESLVLTSSSNFIIYDEKNGKIKELVPTNFKLLEPAKAYKNILTAKSSKIKEIRINKEFFII